MVEEEKLVFKDLTNWTRNEEKDSLRLSKLKQTNKKKTIQIPHPFLKWAGGKRQLLSQMTSYFPQNFNNYIEPFVGGGAVFFYLSRKKLLKKKVIVIDINPDLINCYRVIKNNVEDLIKSLEKHKNEKVYYYTIRGVDRTKEFENWTDVEKASRIIYMNRCCYNGLYRVNSKGQFNVPFGKYKNPQFCNESNLRAVHASLKNVEIIHNSFELCLNFAQKGDFIYFDPPYVPISNSANFTSYTKESFNKENQIQLFSAFKALDEIGCKVMLSNSYCDFIIDLYKDYNIKTLFAKRAINSDASKRGEIEEVLISNGF